MQAVCLWLHIQSLVGVVSLLVWRVQANRSREKEICLFDLYYYVACKHTVQLFSCLVNTILRQGNRFLMLLVLSILLYSFLSSVLVLTSACTFFPNKRHCSKRSESCITVNIYTNKSHSYSWGVECINALGRCLLPSFSSEAVKWSCDPEAHLRF
jgi:hypothetical protein